MGLVPPARQHCPATGIEVTPITIEGLIEVIGESISHQNPIVVAGHNLHSAYLFHTNQTFRNFYNHANVVLCDGMPVFLDYKLSGGRDKNQRIGSTDWIPRISELGTLRVLAIGSSAQSNTMFVRRLSEIAPEATVKGIPGSNWDETSAQIALHQIQAFNPQLVLVGLGMPLQESFIEALRMELRVPVIAAVGGAIDQISGKQRNAPRWLGKIGLEWSWRLISQPRRLGRRYLVEPWKLLAVRLSSNRM